MALGGNKAAGRKASETIKRLDSLRKDSTVVLSFRVSPKEAERIEAAADKQGLRTGQLIRSWVLQRLNG